MEGGVEAGAPVWKVVVGGVELVWKVVDRGHHLPLAVEGGVEGSTLHRWYCMACV